MGNTLAAIICLLCLPAPLLGGYGTSAAGYLKLDPSARSAALGGAFVAAANDASAVYYNPAGMGLLASSELTFSHMELLEGMRYESAAYARPIHNNLTIGAGAGLLMSGPITRYSATGDRTGEYSSTEGNLGFSAALRLGPSLLAGATARVYHQSLDSRSAQALAGDFGALFSAGSWRAGLSVQNLGTELKLHEEGFPLPLSLKAGVLYRGVKRLGLTAQVTKYRNEDPYAGVGAEYSLPALQDVLVFLRGGYKTEKFENAANGLSLGLGLRSGALELNYAFTPMGELGALHRVTFGYKFQDKRQPSWRKALKRRGR